MRFKIRQLLLLICVLLVTGNSARAFALNVALIVSPGDTVHAQFSNALAASASHSNHRIITIELIQGQIGTIPDEPPDLVIAAGFAASEAAITSFEAPVLATLINTRQLGILRTRHPDARLSAILLDQPIERHLRLVRAALADKPRLAVLLGPETLMFEEELARTAAKMDVLLVSRRISTQTELLPALDRILESSDALLILPDPVTSSPTTARAILLSSYRLRRPVLAYSKAFVDAGALAAVFSSPADIGRDTAQWLNSLNASKAIESLPPPRSPRQFGVAVNRQVARALSLDLPDDASLLEQVSAGEVP